LFDRPTPTAGRSVNGRRRIISNLGCAPFRWQVYYSELTVFGLLSSLVVKSLRESAPKIKTAVLTL